jgi:hypothetical protein
MTLWQGLAGTQRQARELIFDRTLMTWTLVKGHRGPVKGQRASGPQGPDALFTHTHIQDPRSPQI